MNAAEQADAQALGPVARLFDARRLFDVVSADLRRSTLTLRMDRDMPVPRGVLFLVSEGEALDLVKREQAEVHLQPPQGDVSVSWFYTGHDLSFQVRASGFRATVYYRRAPESHGRLANRYWGSQCLWDRSGRMWETDLPEMVMDDFGSLVPVDGGVL